MTPIVRRRDQLFRSRSGLPFTFWLKSKPSTCRAVERMRLRGFSAGAETSSQTPDWWTGASKHHGNCSARPLVKKAAKVTRMALTGRFDSRKTPTGRIALQVEEEVTAFWSRLGERKMKRRWRKATLLDLTTPEMRTLMDLRMRPQYWTYTVEIDRAPAPRSAAVVPLSAPVVPEGPGTALTQARSATPIRASS